MGDRCYMSVTCRRQDKERFEQLGFVLEFDQSPNCPVIEMADQQANYAHAQQMPTNIPYTAWNSAGSNYGDGKIACDGKRYAEVAGNNDGFIVAWDYRTMKPNLKSVQRIRQFISIQRRAEQLLKLVQS